MKFPRPRLKVRTMIGLVAVAAVALWGWRTYFDPVRLWQAAIRDKNDANSRWENIDDAAQGKVQGLDTDRAVAELVGVLGDQGLDQQVRSTAAAGLGRFKGEARAGIPALVAALRDETPGVRISSVVAIRQILGDDPADDPIVRDAVAGLIVSMKDPDRRVRHWSACTLGFIGKGEVAVPALIAAWKEPDLPYMEKMQIINALRRSGPSSAAALPAILETAKVATLDGENQGGEAGRQGNASALINAALFLHDFGKTDQACEILRQLANDRDPQVADEAKKTLRTIEPDQAETPK